MQAYSIQYNAAQPWYKERRQEIELSRQRHDGDLREKNRLARMLENKKIFQERVMSRRQAEFDRLRTERADRINQIILARKQEREAKRKKIFYVRTEEERLKKLHEEEEARKMEEAERRRKEDAERKAKLDEIAEKQRQRERELEEKERLRREALLWKSSEGPARPTSDLPPGPRPVEPVAAAPAAAAAAPTPGKYVPKFRRERPEGTGQASSQEPDRWGGSSKPDDRPWRSDDRRTSFGGGSRPTWSSSRIPPRGTER